MIRSGITHPDLLAGLARLGHGSKILIADAMYPALTGAFAGASRVWLNLCAGMVPAVDVVRLIGDTINIEDATYMASPDGASEPVTDYRRILAGHRHWGGQQIRWDALDRLQFYDACQTPALGLVVVTGEMRSYANLLLSVSVP